MSRSRTLTLRRFLPSSMLVLVMMAGVTGCPFLVKPPDDASRPTGPATTETRIPPAGNGVAMLDLSGNWFFVLRTPDGQAIFTQRGDFATRSDGKILYADQWYVQGFKADDQGQLRTDKLRDLKVILGQASPVWSTTRVALAGNINPEDAKIGDLMATTFTVYDAAGGPSELYAAAVVTAKDSASTQLRFDVQFGSSTGELMARATFQYDDDGGIVGQSSLQVSHVSPSLSFSLDVSAVETSSRKDPSLGLASQDGVGAGTLQSYVIGNNGAVTGQFSNGLSLLLGQFVIASFDGPENLAPLPGRNDLFTETDTSGSPRPAISVAQ